MSRVPELFDRYSRRTRRVIFWSIHYARAAGSGYIEPEHLLQALLLEDPQLFQLLLPDKPTLVQDLKAALNPGSQSGFRLTEGKDMPLSPLGKAVALAAGTQQQQLGHKQIANQHLLLALLVTPARSAGWFAKEQESPVQQLLSRHDITAQLVHEKTKGGIVTPTTWILDDVVISLNSQLAALSELLIGKGMFTRAEFVACLDKNVGPLPPESFLLPLVAMLEKKGILTSTERDMVKGTGTPESGAEKKNPETERQQNDGS